MWLIVTQDNCKPCKEAKELLDEHGVQYRELNVNKVKGYKRLMLMAGLKTTPQVFDDVGNHIGGRDDLAVALLQYYHT